ncbi:MAG: redoxin domain-containing protein [Caldithrix sp.]|nr:redoxin domain-containing protein [Caldithrix sp.]
MFRIGYTFIAFILLILTLPLKAVDVGEEAPDFTLEKLSGSSITLSNLRGQVVYIFWFGYS